MSEQAFDWNKVLKKDEESETPNLEAVDGAQAGTAPESTNASESAPAGGLKFSIADNDAMADAEQDIADIVNKMEGKSKPTANFELVVNNGADGEPVAEAPQEEYKHYKPAALPDDLYTRPLKETSDIYIGMEHAEVKAGTEVASDAKSVKDVHIDEILRSAIERKASDIHFTTGLPPMARIDGELQPLPYQIIDPEDSQRMIYEVLSDEQIQKVEQSHELDFGYGVKGLGRFRFNVYFQKGAMAAALRAIPTRIPAFEELGLPPVLREMSKRVSGLVLVTGPTGSGKSTTIASMIDDINESRTSHILTIEDPIEYLHSHKKCMVNQRELHADTYTFHNALRAVLREDPDIILVGELRDLETIEAALTLAETGHLVFGTLHTRNAPSTIDRIVDVFSADQQEQIRVLLGNTLEGVISQQLIPRLGGGRSAALEIMQGTPAIKNLIREGKTHQMYSIIETNAQHGMQTMDRSLADLFKNGYCTYEECLMRAVDKESFARLAKGTS
ncbi:MAG: type IV pilus twitching motility protein PilT [Fimbriimonadaceae bacterium]|nr:type IV pilus twitching motility protein PilT [Fimbriimonadaceae bacterium]